MKFSSPIRTAPIIAIFLFAAMGISTHAQEPESKDESTISQADLNFFESKIRPVLVDKCYQCHSESGDKVAGGLLVDSREGLLRGGNSGSAIEPGSADDSLLMTALEYEDDDYAMPPSNAGGKLADEVIDDFRKWINRGAPDPRNETTIAPDGGAGEEAKSWWAYQPLTNPQLPKPTDSTWSSHPVDQFLLAKLEASNLKPVDDAEPLALIRRLYFDLTGLPPSPEEAKSFQEAWENAASPSQREAAYERVVDSLLASPRFGEHWGRHWMDVVRFAESSGKDLNVTYPQAWRYRDYIIDSFNQDVPFDQFIKEQLAGDLLPADSEAERARNLIATGFLAIGPKSVNERSPRQLAVDIADEQIDTMSQSLLGVTISCARCHDHKFDPVSQVDYTAMLGIFLSTETHYGSIGGVGGRNKSSLITLPDSVQKDKAIAKMSKRELEQKQKQIAQLRERRTELQRQRIEDRRKGVQQQGNELLRVTTQLNALETELASFDDEGNPVSMAMGVSDKPKQVSAQFRRARGRNNGGFVSITDSPLFTRGEVDRPGETVRRSLPELFEGVRTPRIPTNTSGRLQLANWIVDDQNPLTSRVFVNRVWHWLYGTGIVTSVDNFGTTGDTPSHAELLDYLANHFVQHGHSTKDLIRLLVTSRSYRLSTTFDDNAFHVDPANELIWRHNPKRLEAEAVRDSILHASGDMKLEHPGASLVGQTGDGVIGRGRGGLSERQIVTADDPVRTVYLPQTRDVEPEILSVFNGPDSSAVQGARQITNVPGQALFLLNSDFVEKHAESIAEDILGKKPSQRRMRQVKPSVNTKDFDDQFDSVCWKLLTRPATAKETAAAKKVLLTHRDDPWLGWTSIVRALMASAEFRSIE